MIDAGIASTANLEAIQTAGFSYIAVSRSRPQEMSASGMVVIKETNATTIQVQRLNQDGEVIPGSPAQTSETNDWGYNNKCSDHKFSSIDLTT